MKQYHVTFSKLARRQLDHLYDDIADLSHPDIALGYVERIEAFCHRLDIFPERGTERPDIRPGLRIVGFERRTTIAFTVVGNRVVILQVLYGGQDIETRLT